MLALVLLLTSFQGFSDALVAQNSPESGFIWNDNLAIDKNHKVNVRGNQSELIYSKTDNIQIVKSVEPNKYMLKLEQDKERVTTTEIYRTNGFAGQHNYNARTTVFNNNKLFSLTTCEPSRGTLLMVEKVDMNKCITITPSFCAGLRTFLNESKEGGVFEKMQTCKNIVSNIDKELNKLVSTDEYKDYEKRGINRIKQITLDLNPKSKFGTTLLGFNEMTQKASNKLEGGFSLAVIADTMEDLNTMASKCEVLNSYFANPKQINGAAPSSKRIN